MSLNRKNLAAPLGVDGDWPERDGPQKLRIGARELHASEVFEVRNFVQRSGRFRANFPWVFVDDPPFDTVVVDYQNQHRLKINIADLAGGLLLITDDDTGFPNTMQRPLSFRVLEDWLKRKATEIRFNSRDESEQQQPLAAVELSDGRDAYLDKLDRWPPSAFLSRDPLRLRVATILATNGMNLSDLARVCRESEARTRDCVFAFQEAGLIELRHSRRKPGMVLFDSHQRTDVATSMPKPRLGLGLIASIRRRLGI